MGYKVHAPMSPSKRAKQFMPFDALKGLKEALEAKERIPVPKRVLAEDQVENLNRILSVLQPGQIVTVVYYCEYAQAYTQLTGEVEKVDPYWQFLQVGKCEICFSEIYDLIPV